MIPAPASEVDDVATILGLRSPAGTVVASAAWLAFLFLGVASGGINIPVVYLLGFAALGVGWALILRSPGDPMRVRDAAATAASGAVACVLSVVATDPTDRAVLLALGAAPAVTFAMLAFRGRIAVAWAGMIAGGIGIIGVAVIRGADVAAVAAVAVPGNIGVLIMATFFAILVRPRAKQIGSLRRRAERDRGPESVRLVRDARVARLQGQVRPLLEHIASGEPLTEEQVAVCRLVEAGLRDRIRAPGLDVPDVAEAAWDARARGVRVLLLDDRDSPRWGDDASRLARVRTAAVGALVGARSEAQVTVRLMPEGRDLVGTIAIAEDGQVRRIEFRTDDLTDTTID
ncbi:hypothetical protein [Gordonia phthalatica]|uniref:Uncharacterized protein n=1 Tax=Gordonia phthalatica TaxID=1136941 RepID=A0A0N9NLH8_9ACTN|nr:hypothetical protein [Gordonia phthalatica]ALG86953.1 hypothetical protein ACH46_15685 [Gordonia phthalatica]